MLFVENYILKTMQTIIDRLVGRIKSIGNPTAAGLDTLYEYTPSQKKNPSMEYAASASMFVITDGGKHNDIGSSVA
jgi:hypothetical protein